MKKIFDVDVSYFAPLTFCLQKEAIFEILSD